MSELSVVTEAHWFNNEKAVPVELCVVNVTSDKPTEIAVPKEEWHLERKSFYFDTGTKKFYPTAAK